MNKSVISKVYHSLVTKKNLYISTPKKRFDMVMFTVTSHTEKYTVTIFPVNLQS